ncbi:MAG: diguanylate cyclase [Acidobacteria bacterium]|nr:diguanylate cyclase [Acidobacteriota bacterium]
MDEIKKNSILIVDDEKSNLMVLTHVLSQEYTIFTAKDGHDAINKARKLLPDLILLDIIMPGLNGYEVLAKLKNSERTRDIPVIFITGLDSSEDEEKGLILNAADYISKPFRPAIIKLRIRNQIQIVNQLRTIERLSMIDQLTNIPNRRSFDNRLNMEWKRAIREKTTLSLFMIDVDKFKVYNDTYGHQQGDVVLRTVAEVFMRTIRRPGDFAARWGGEEFAVLLPTTDMIGALIVAEQIRANVEKAVIACPYGGITKVTISIGVNTKSPDGNSSLDGFISGADSALYAAKEKGRNRVCQYEEV